eukprot:403359815
MQAAIKTVYSQTSRRTGNIFVSSYNPLHQVLFQNTYQLQQQKSSGLYKFNNRRFSNIEGEIQEQAQKPVQKNSGEEVQEERKQRKYYNRRDSNINSYYKRQESLDSQQLTREQDVYRYGGSTAVRKSSKIVNIISEVSDRMDKCGEDVEEYVHILYFITRLSEFEMLNKIQADKKFKFVRKTIDLAVEQIEQMHIMNLMRVFGDLITIDPAISLANRMTQMISNPEYKLNAVQAQRILHYIARSHAPRLYSQMYLAIGERILQETITFGTQDEIKQKVKLFQSCLDCERKTYLRLWEVVSKLQREILGRVNEMSQLDMIKVVEAAKYMRPHAQQIILQTCQEYVAIQLNDPRNNRTNLMYLGIRFYGAVLKYEEILNPINNPITQVPTFQRLDMGLLSEYLDIIMKNQKLLTDYEQTTVSQIDFTRMLGILDFVFSNKEALNSSNFTPNPDKVIHFLIEALIGHYDRLAFAMSSETSRKFAKVFANKIFANPKDQYERDQLKRIQDVCIKYIKLDATRLKFIVQGLEIFDALGIIKNENRKQLLINLREALRKPELRSIDTLYMIKMYPINIKSKAYESMLLNLYQRFAEKGFKQNMVFESSIFLQLTSENVPQELIDVCQPILDKFQMGKVGSKGLNLLLDELNQRFRQLTFTNHYKVLQMLNNQEDIDRVQSTVLQCYLDNLDQRFDLSNKKKNKIPQQIQETTLIQQEVDKLVQINKKMKKNTSWDKIQAHNL